MLFEGKIHAKKKGENFYSVELPELGVFTQGKNIKDCYKMVKEAVELMVDEKGFKIEVIPVSKTKFMISGSDLRPLMALFLQDLRAKSGLTLKQIQKRLGLKSVNGYAQYEQAKALPGMNLLTDFVKAMKGDFDLILKTQKIG